MGVFDIFKKKDEGTPPDVGSEEKEEVKDSDNPFGDVEKDSDAEDKSGNEEETEGEDSEETEEVDAEENSGDGEEVKPKRKLKKGKKIKSALSKKSVEVEPKIPELGKMKRGASLVAKRESEQTKAEMQRFGTRIDSLNALIKGYSERLSLLSQQIGEVRAMNVSNEKEIIKMSAEAAKAVDIVKSVKPEKLRVDYQKSDMLVKQLEERIESNKQFMETVMRELKDIRRKMGTFLGTDELLKLNDDVKKDLIETQHIAARARLHADKIEQLFSEMRRTIAENQRIGAKVNDMDTNYAGIQKEVERLRIDFSNIVKQGDFDDFKKSVNNKVILMDKNVKEVEKVSDENQRLGRIIETILAMSKQNKRDIADIAMTLGDDQIKHVSDYDNKLASILQILDSLAGKINVLERKLDSSQKPEKISVKKIGKKRLKLKNIDLHPKVTKELSKRPEVSEKLKEIHKNRDKESVENVLDRTNKNIVKKVKSNKNVKKVLKKVKGKIKS